MKKTFRIIKIVIILILCLSVLSGCWDSKDIEKRDILSTLIVDKKNDEYCYYTKVANILGGQAKQKEGITSKSEFSILISKGKNFLETRDDINRKTGKELFLGAARILIFTDRMSKNGIEEYVNRLRGQADYRKSLSIATTDSEPLDLLNTEPENAISIGFGTEATLENLVQKGTSFTVNIGDVLQIMAVKKVGFLVPTVNIKEEKITLTGYTVFKNEKKIGEIPAENRKGIVFLLNSKSKFYYIINQSDKNYTVEVKLKSKKIKPDYIDNQLHFNIDMNFDATINIIDKMEPISQEDFTSISKNIEETTKKDLEQAIDTSQHKYKCDYLNFYKYYRINYLKEFEKADWCELYSNAKVNITTHVNITQTDIPLKQ